jgi:hypothetical protein
MRKKKKKKKSCCMMTKKHLSVCIQKVFARPSERPNIEAQKDRHTVPEWDNFSVKVEREKERRDDEVNRLFCLKNEWYVTPNYLRP